MRNIEDNVALPFPKESPNPHTIMKYTLLLLPMLLLSACVKHQQLVNFNQGPELSATPQAITNLPVIRIQPDDALAISVHTINMEAAEPFNLGISSAQGSTAGSAAVVQGNFLVDPIGFIEYPSLGRIKAGGLTTTELKDTLLARLAPYLKDPIVYVRFTNFTFTVLGEVKTPGAYTFPEEKMTILEAIGRSGDLTDYGDRTNILVIREQDGTRSFGRINLRDRNVFESPYFYLRQNDVIYVEPLRQKSASVADQTSKIFPWVSVAVTVLNLIIIISINQN